MIDSRAVTSGDLFIGFPGERVDGGAFAKDALGDGAWGVLVTPGRAAALTAEPDLPPGAVLTRATWSARWAGWRARGAATSAVTCWR